MKLFSKTYNIKADIERVFYCFSDFDYIQQEIRRLKDDDEIEVLKQDDELVFKGKSALYRVQQTEVTRPVFFRAQLIPASEDVLRLGSATITCHFKDCGKTTRVLVDINSSKTPGFLWRSLIKVILFILELQSRSDEKKYIKAIENNE